MTGECRRNTSIVPRVLLVCQRACGRKFTSVRLLAIGSEF
jgi:hypothetical protein